MFKKIKEKTKNLDKHSLVAIGIGWILGALHRLIGTLDPNSIQTFYFGGMIIIVGFAAIILGEIDQLHNSKKIKK